MRLELADFRSYGQIRLVLSDLTVLVGRNGSGKTNVLEAIALLSSGMSFRAGKIEEMIAWEKELANISGIVENTGEGGQRQYTSLGVVLTRGQVLGHKTPKRRYLIDGVSRNRAKLVGLLPSIIFRPEDMRLIEGSPSRRRRFLDETISISSVEYARSLPLYESALRQRNRLLDMLREGKARREQFAYWDQMLLKHGEVVMRQRRAFINFINTVKVAFGEYEVFYDSSAISPTRLLQYQEQEVMVGYTMVGPHKDDFIISSQFEVRSTQEKKDLMKYGSRGEQRLGVLFLKLAALQYAYKVLGVRPILLLDDIFSELDSEHRIEVLKMVREHQCVMTTAEDGVLSILPEGAKVIKL
jgi:DNA replication and repair protein RecF